MKLKINTGSDAILGSLMLLPALALFLVFVITPLIGGAFLGFTNWDGVSPALNFVGLKNYVEIFTSETSITPLKNTIVFAFLSTISINVCALAVAVALNRKLHTKKFLRTVFFLPTVLSPLVVGFVFSFIFSVPIADFGKKIGVEVIAYNLIGSSQWALHTAIFTNTWRMLGWYMIIYIAGLQNIPQDLYEACDIDGASAWQRFRGITFPLIAPALTINLVLSVSRAFKEYDLVYALTNGGPGISSQIISMSIYRESFVNRRAGYGSALGIVLFVMILIITLIQINILRKRERNAEY
ncbi:sugar ABC transporter permease [Oceanispirochaeta crateris]|uniref:Sugar ABC transporter permease n=1 Tax=Oceanispirochaeta crateris TaxID=2518645 RepID=A0A5C1QPP2_9SPIO|nr:sugar ABC transporter permease [Oceanispirochaeta crateris]QEN09437.1 sugar ABC transporter permease [Oceanispirochaeta crateris]